MPGISKSLLIIVLGLIAFPSGCATFKQDAESKQKEASFFSRMTPFGKKKSDETPEPYPNPVKMAATWTPDTLVQTGRTPTRGFGGRIFFYDEKSRSVPVDGSLIVHGFDDSGETSKQPAKRYEFTPEQFTRHFSQGDLGASYSVWIPWDAIGGEQKRISLVASFKDADGKLIQGIPATVLLPGSTTENSLAKDEQRLSPQYKEFRAAASRPPTSGLTTTTIARRRTSLQNRTAPERFPVALNIGNKPSDKLSSQNATPSLEIEAAKKPKVFAPNPTIMPASANLPLNW